MYTTTTMPRRRLTARLLATALLALLALVAMAPAAGATSGARARICVGLIESEVVDGGLIVPAGASCELRGTTVRGDVHVAGGGDDFATLDAAGARIGGDLRIGQQGNVRLDDTRVGGNVKVVGAWALLDASGGAIGGRVRAADAERINLSGTTVGGNVRFERSRLFTARGAQIAGQIRAAEVEFASIVESRVGGNVAIEGAHEEARVCNSRIGGSASFERNTGKVTIGGGSPALRCGGSTFDGHLRVHQNTGGVTITGNAVGGNLACRDNNPLPIGGSNKVGGHKQDQCGGL